MTKGKPLELQLTRVKGRRVRVDFKGGLKHGAHAGLVSLTGNRFLTYFRS